MHIFAWSPNPYAPKNRRRPMVPVHRFQHFDSMLIDSRGRFDGAAQGRYGRGRRWGSRSRLPRHIEDVENTRVRPPEAASVPTTSHERAQSTGDSSTPVQQPIFPNNFNRFRMGSINWSLWGCFIVITALLVPAHIYLKQYAYRGELMGVFFVITLLFLVCFSVSMFHTKTRMILLHRLHLEEEMRASSSAPTNDQCQQLSDLRPFSHRDNNDSGQQMRATMSTPDLHLTGDTRIGIEDGTRSHQSSDTQGFTRSTSQASRGSDLSPSCDPFGEPPPYDIAVLLPTPSPEGFVRTCETPPPAYDIIQ